MYILPDDCYLIQKKLFCLHLIGQQDSKINGYWVWKLVSTTLKLIDQHKLITSNKDKNKKCLKLQKIKYQYQINWKYKFQACVALQKLCSL